MPQARRIFGFAALRVMTGAIGLLLLASPVQAVPRKKPVGQGIAFNQLKDSFRRESFYSFIIEGQNHFKQRMTIWGVRQYGFAQSRLELGAPSGITLDAVSGIVLHGLDDREEGVIPFLGMEPFSGHVTWNTGRSDLKERFYEWLPMLSAGFQLGSGSCRILSLVKGGLAIGNLSRADLLMQSRLGWALGAHLNCERFHLGFVATQLKTPGSFSNFQMTHVDLSVENPGLPVFFGVRAEVIQLSPRSEQRLMLMIRSDFN